MVTPVWCTQNSEYSNKILRELWAITISLRRHRVAISSFTRLIFRKWELLALLRNLRYAFDHSNRSKLIYFSNKLLFEKNRDSRCDKNMLWVKFTSPVFDIVDKVMLYSNKNILIIFAFICELFMQIQTSHVFFLSFR
jgi:hypothetical protein